MDPAIAVSVLLAKHRADVAMAYAAKMQGMNPDAAAKLLEAMTRSAEEVERAAATVAKGMGEALDITV